MSLSEALSADGAARPFPAAAATPAADRCYHCELPVRAGTAYELVARDGVHRRFCCPGCEAVSRSIADLGLDDYYRLRETTASRLPERALDAGVFDNPAVAARYVSDRGSGIAEARLLIEGMRCAACAWLLEQTLSRIYGVEAVQVQFAARRVTVRWQRAACPPSAFIRAIERIGYRAWPFEEGRVALVAAGEQRSLLRRLWVAGLSMMQVMMYAVPAYVAIDGEMTGDAESLLHWAGMLLTLPVMLYSAVPFLAGAWRALAARTLGMDVPIALGVVVAFVASAWSTLTGDGPVYFDSVTMFVFLLLAARYLEVLALGRAGQALLSLGRIVPEQAHRLLRAGDLASETVLAATLVPGDRIVVRPGETVPADGILESAVATVGEAWMTGESRPVTRKAGATVLCGSVNAGSAFVVSVARVGGDTAVSGILRLIERSLAERPHWVALAERAVPVFVGAVLVAALLAFGAWLTIDPSRALWIAVAVLIVTCPCALALATPVAMTVATGALARANVAVTRGRAIEALAGVTHVVFDKTGTLTTGEPALTDILPLDGHDPDAALAIAAALAQGSSHPLDAALRRAAGARPASGTRRADDHAGAPSAGDHASEPGHGIEAVVGGVRVRLGRAGYAAAIAPTPAPIAILGAVDTCVWLASERGWIAAFRFRDLPRADARAAVADLAALGIDVALLSGDDDAIVKSTAAELGLRTVRSRATPEEKVAYVRALQQDGARVAMVGDGINDAPVLGAADVAIAMHSGADLAKVRADAVLLSDAPNDLATGIRIARKTRAVIRQNLAWALGYNLVVIPLAVTGHVSPLVAGLGMSLSSLLVVVNSLRAR
jgi:Cu2+-exporting ATPase